MLQATFPPGSHLLEIGCGTGDEALALSRAGSRIVATDISPAMIEAARAKAGPGRRVRYLAGAARRAAGRTGSTTMVRDAFDGAYASFGALNCEPDLAPTVTALAELLRPGAALVCSVMNRCCAWEIGWGLVHLRPRQAFRRLGRGWLEAGLASPEGRLAVPARYYSPRSFARFLAPTFGCSRCAACRSCCRPPTWPPSSSDPALFGRLEGMERRCGDASPSAAWATTFCWCWSDR